MATRLTVSCCTRAACSRLTCNRGDQTPNASIGACLFSRDVVADARRHGDHQLADEVCKAIAAKQHGKKLRAIHKVDVHALDAKLVIPDDGDDMTVIYQHQSYRARDSGLPST